MGLIESFTNQDSARILVVDDEPDFLEDISKKLVERGYSVFAEDNADAAILAGKSQSIDIILADVRLPGGKDGWEVIREVKKSHPEAESIAITAFYEPEFKNKAKDLGLFACVEKPISLDLLTNLIWSCSENQRLRKELITLQAGHANHVETDPNTAIRERSIMQDAMDALPFPVFVLEQSGSLLLSNSCGNKFLSDSSSDASNPASQLLPPEVLEIIEATTSPRKSSKNSNSRVESRYSDGETEFVVRAWALKNTEGGSSTVVFLEPPRLTSEALFDSEAARVWMPIILKLAD